MDSFVRVHYSGKFGENPTQTTTGVLRKSDRIPTEESYDDTF